MSVQAHSCGALVKNGPLAGVLGLGRIVGVAVLAAEFGDLAIRIVGTKL